MKLLVCGTRGAKYLYGPVEDALLKLKDLYPNLTIIHGDCPDSADEVANEICGTHGIPVITFPSTEHNYLKRNIEMAEMADECIAFWDGFSYGTAHTIAHMTKRGKPVKVIEVSKKRG